MHLTRTLAALTTLALTAAGITSGASEAAATAAPPPVTVASSLAGVHPTGEARRAVHRLYVVAIQDPSATYDVSLATARSIAATAGRYWVTQTRGGISWFPVRAARSITRSGSCHVTDPWAFLDQVGAAAFPGVTFGQGTGNHLVVFRPNSCSSATWGAGIGTIGAAEHEGGKVLLTVSVPSILEHELGHNLGLRHSNLVVRTSSGTHVQQYLGEYDAMGSDPRPGWLSIANQLRLAVPGTASHVKSVAPSSRKRVVTVTLTGTETTTGLRGLTFQDPRTRTRYVVELRDGQGADAKALYARGYGRSSASSATWYSRGVRVTRIASDGSVETMTVRSGRTYRAALAAGQTLTGPGGRFTVHVRTLGRWTARVTLTLAAA